jgi:hypothetical protein
MRIGRKDKDDEADGRSDLEKQVDDMLDPKRPADRESRAEPEPDIPVEVPGDHKPKVRSVSSPAQARTAPRLSDDLRKKIGIKEADTKPLSIDKLDEITVKAADSSKEESDEDDKDDVPPKDFDEGSTDLDDARTDEAVEDIVSHEGDVMLAVEDATRKKNNPGLDHPTEKKKGGHRLLATIMWTLVTFLAIIAVLFLVLLVTGGDVTGSVRAH